MTTNFSATPTASAKIYAFPPRGRFALRVDDTAPAAANVQLPHGVKLVSGSSWYHDEAILAEDARKN
ncbi:MAG TPA: DUF2735 domain-containing protein [Xanthobacteraceae bacterium]|nr:DUF2735 domain-containing protein [Xanthobacteraceae bacterium]